MSDSRLFAMESITVPGQQEEALSIAAPGPGQGPPTKRMRTARQRGARAAVGAGEAGTAGASAPTGAAVAVSPKAEGGADAQAEAMPLFTSSGRVVRKPDRLTVTASEPAALKVRPCVRARALQRLD